MKRLTAPLTLLALMAAPVLAETATWNIDPAHTTAQFIVRHMMVTNVRGEFGKVSGTVVGDPKDPTKATIETTIDVASITTREPKRDDHLRSGDFFDAAKFPSITFRSKKIEADGAGKLRITGDLTIRGVTKSVVLEAEGPTPEINAGGATKVGLSATTKVNRKDFGVSWNRNLDGGGIVVGDDVSIQLDVELNKVKEPAKEAGKEPAKK